MKMSKKKIFVSALAICLIAILSLGSLAWFNATETITNTFKFDDTNNDGTPDFSIDVFETDGEDEVDAKEYLEIVPNAVLPKDPTVRNTGDYAMYTRLIVTVSDAASWVTAAAKYDLTEEGKETEILEKMVAIDSNWVRYENPVRDVDADTITYVYYYNGVVAEGTTTTALFASVTIPHQLQTEDMTFGDDAFTIDVKGDAIQAENIIPANGSITEGNDAYKAFAYAKWAAGQAYPEPNA